MDELSPHGGTILSVARKSGLSPAAIRDFSASINPLGPAPEALAAARKGLLLTEHYPETGSPLLCGALAAHHSLLPENIAVANGSTELIYLLPRLFAQSGRALIIAPTFSEYARGLTLAGWGVEYHCLSPENGFALDLTALSARLEEGFDLVWLCNPGNPTGRLYRHDEVAELLRISKNSGTFTVIDEAFMDFCEMESVKSLAVSSDSVMVLRSMTKFYGFPGVRVGYAIASAVITEKLKGLIPPWSVGIVAQKMAEAALTAELHNKKTIGLVERERRYLFGGLKKNANYQLFEGAANYLLIKIRRGSAAEICSKGLENGFLIRDCSNFVGLDSSFFRIAVRRRGANRELLQLLAGFTV